MTPLAIRRSQIRHVLNQARGWGWPGALGAVAVCAALAGGAIWLPALERESGSLTAEVEAAEFRAMRQSARRDRQAQTPPSPQRFRDAFPSARDRQERLAALIALAVEHGLEPQRTELRLSRDADLDMLRYSVSMPLVGPYAQLRAFIEAAQARDPALGLDRLRLRRASAKDETVETELGWTFYMQPERLVGSGGQDARGASR
ncbi:MAG: hypothetical protein ACSLE9_13340 [Burkholderiaceae bacterium]